MIDLKLDVPSIEQFRKLADYVKELARQHNELEARYEGSFVSLTQRIADLEHVTSVLAGKPTYATELEAKVKKLEAEVAAMDGALTAGHVLAPKIDGK